MNNDYLCAVCYETATFVPERAGSFVSCDEHIGLIAALNAVRDRLNYLHYNCLDVPATLTEQHRILWIEFSQRKLPESGSS